MSGASVGALVMAVTLSGLKADTTYHVRVQATGSAIIAGDSDFSAAKSTKTGIASNDETVTHYQSWLTELQAMTRDFARSLKPPN